MPVLLPPIQDPTDTVLQGEQLRVPNEDPRPSYPGNVIFGPIMGGDISGLQEITQDEDAFLPMNSYVEINQLSVRRSKDEGFRIRDNGGIATPCGAWIPLDTSPLLLLNTGGFARLFLSGVTRDSTGTPLGDCTVKVFRTASDSKAFEVVSDGSGNWSFELTEPGPFYYVCYKVGSPDVAGTSINTNVPTSVLL